MTKRILARSGRHRARGSAVLRFRDRSTCVCVFYPRVLYLAKSTNRPFGAPVSRRNLHPVTDMRGTRRQRSPSKGGAMSYAKALLDTYPRTFDVDAAVLAATIEALNDCAQACTAD